MRKSGGALLVVVGLLAGGCAQSIKDIKVPADFQQVVKDISAGAQPAFSGKTCFSQPFDNKDSWRYMADYTVPGSLDTVAKQLRKDGLARGYQPYRTKDGKFMMVGKYKDEDIVVGVAAEGQQTKVSVVSEWNCGGTGDGVSRHPMNTQLLDANPDLEPRQKRLLEGAYNAGRDAGIALHPLMDRDNRSVSEYALPSPPSDDVSIDLRGCDADGKKSRGALWTTLGGVVVSGYLKGTDDLLAGEQRVLAALGKQWQVIDRRVQDGANNLIEMNVERKVDNVPLRLNLVIHRRENSKNQMALETKGRMDTGCVPATA